MNQPSSSPPQKLEPPQKQPSLCYKISRSYYTLHYTFKPSKNDVSVQRSKSLSYQTRICHNPNRFKRQLVDSTRVPFLSHSSPKSGGNTTTPPPSLNRFIVCLNSTSTAYDHAQETSSLVRCRNFLFCTASKKREEERQAGRLTKRVPTVPNQNIDEL